jgi:hypothetical protein
MGTTAWLTRTLGCVLATAMLAMLVPARAEATSHDPLSSLKSRDPHEVLAWQGDSLVARTDSLPADEAPLARELASGLRNAKAAGHLTISKNFAVQATLAGIQSLTDLAQTSYRGCVRLENITADWLGFHADAVPLCTAQEMEQRASAHSAAMSKGPTPIVHADPGGLEVSDDFNCLLSVAGLALAAIGVAALVANPVTGAWIWLSWAAAGGGAFLSWVSFVLNCTGIRAVNQKVREPAGDSERPCRFVSYENRKWSWKGFHFVPTKANWAC